MEVMHYVWKMLQEQFLTMHKTNELVKSNEIKFLTGAGLIKSSVENDIVETQLTTPKVIKKVCSRWIFGI